VSDQRNNRQQQGQSNLNRIRSDCILQTIVTPENLFATWPVVLLDHNATHAEG
jgi:hypothetical protein